MLAGLAAAKHAAVIRLVVETSFLAEPALAGLPKELRRDPGTRTELIFSPIARQTRCSLSTRRCPWLAGGDLAATRRTLHAIYS